MPNTPPSFAGSIPENYDRYLGPYIFEPYAQRLAELAASGASGISQQTPKVILETACGTGRVTRHLQTLLPDARLVATDIHGDMLNIARRLTPGVNNSSPGAKPHGDSAGIEWQTADAQALPFDDHTFDLVISQFGLMFVPDKQKALTEAYRVLQPGGRLLFNTWDSLENNPAFYLADNIVKTYFPIDPPRFFHIPFSLYDDRQLTDWVKNAGFTNIHISLLSLTGHSPSAADVAAGMLEGSPMYTTLNEHDPALLPIIKEDLTKALGREFGAAPLASPMAAWIIEAVRPG